MVETVNVGKADRLVVPKSIRDQLGLREGSRIRLEIQDGTLQAVPELVSIRIEIEIGFPVIWSGPPMKRGQEFGKFSSLSSAQCVSG